MAYPFKQEEGGLEWQEHGCVWVGLRCGGREGMERKVRNRLLQPTAQSTETFKPVGIGESAAIFTSSSSPQAGWFPTVGPCYKAPPTAPFNKPVLSSQEKENLLF